MKKIILAIILIGIISAGYLGYKINSSPDTKAHIKSHLKSFVTADNNSSNTNNTSVQTNENNQNNTNTNTNTNVSKNLHNSDIDNTSSKIINTPNNNNNNISKYFGTYSLNIYPFFVINHLVSSKLNLAKTVTIEKNIFKNGNYTINNPYYYIFKDPDGHYIGGYGSNYLSNPLTLFLVSSNPLSQSQLPYMINAYNSFIVQDNSLLVISEENGSAKVYGYQK